MQNNLSHVEKDSQHSNNLLANENSEASPQSFDWGVEALVQIARFHDIPTDAGQVRHLIGVSHRDLTIDEVADAGRQIGLSVKQIKTTAARVENNPCPALACDKEGKHFILIKCDDKQSMILEVGQRMPVPMQNDELIRRTGGSFVLFTSKSALIGDKAKFDFTWFIPSIIKYRWLLLQTLFASIIIQLFGLVSPLMFQVVLDKVLVNRAMNTLIVVSIALLISAIFECTMTALRNFVFSHTINKVDVELGVRMFNHLIHLPIRYFQARRVGDTIARVRELDRIRSFLTGQALVATLDVLFSVIFFCVMWIYSVKLTLIVIFSIPFYVAISMFITPILRRRLNDKFATGSQSQSFLVEAVSSAETIKSMAVEQHFKRRWNEQLARYVQASFKVGNIENAGQQSIAFVGKFVNLMILFVGVEAVGDGSLTIGKLIAFNMLAAHVSTPILRLSQLWQELQQFSLSMNRMADVFDTPIESMSDGLSISRMSGDLRFDAVTFRYGGLAESQPVLHSVSFDAKAGQVIGIVGRSGSGKSTITKLIQKMYVPESGRIFIDGHDIAHVDPLWIRRNIGVVLQESKLFAGTIRQNIALSDPTIGLDEVIQVAKMAGAHEFITELSQGYDTQVHEQGANLSGGQKQRLAIARALLKDPKILIFDEATSALDFESEAIIRENMKFICKGRTVIIIAHRLSAVKEADKIFVMDNGYLVESGSHEELVVQSGHFARLLSFQH